MVTPINPASQAGPSQSPRQQFLDGLSPRLNTLSAMVDALTSEASSAAAESLVRRLRAMRAAADAVGLEEIGAEFDTCAAALAGKTWSPGVRSELHEHLSAAGRLGHSLARQQSEAALAEQEQRPSGPVPAAPPPPNGLRRSTPVGPFTVVALASESQKVILRQALEQADEFNLYCTQDAGEAAALLSTYDPDLFVVDGRRADVVTMIGRGEDCGVMVVDARLPDVERFRDSGARWVTTIGEHYETELLEGLRHRRRSQSMIAPRGDGAVTLAQFAEEVADEIKQALLKTANGHGGETLLPLGEGTTVQTAVWSMLARLRETVTDLSHGSIKYDPHTPSGAMIVTGNDAMRRGGRTRASAENLAGRKILVAEDDTSVGWYLTSLLRSKGAIVTEASEGIEALRQARRDAPDLVICDVMLPALDGFALCRNLKHDVALSDVPVILLSWKEDLLQRVRELGAGADGYLAKEAEASVIVERCAEALEPRARIEKRLLLERVVHGRLDGVTPRLVLQLASRAVDNAKVVLQDAAFQYEVCLGDGRILTARRKAADGSVESGEKVLPGLLGMRAGRFTVERIRESVQAELYGSVDKVLAPFIERARRATRRLKGADLYDVVRLEVDTKALEPYLSVSPPIVNQIVARLRDGASPGDLLHSVSASLLESVLEDLALRGGILRVVSADGDDMLDEEQRDSVAAFDMELRSSRVKPATGAPVVGPGSSREDAEAAADYAGLVNESRRQSQRPSYAPVVVPGPSRALDPAASELEYDRRSNPPTDTRSTVMGLAPEAPRPERISGLPPLPQATLTRDDDLPRGNKGVPTFRPPPPSIDDTPPSGTNWMIPEAAIGGSDASARADILPSKPASRDATTVEVKVAGHPDRAGDSLAQTMGGGWTPVEARVSRRAEAGRVVFDGTDQGDGGMDLADMVAGLSATPSPAPVQVVRRPLVKVGAGSGGSDPGLGGNRADTNTLTGLGAPDDASAAPPETAPANMQDGWRAPSLSNAARETNAAARDLSTTAPNHPAVSREEATGSGTPALNLRVLSSNQSAPTHKAVTGREVPATAVSSPNRRAVVDLGSTAPILPTAEDMPPHTLRVDASGAVEARGVEARSVEARGRVEARNKFDAPAFPMSPVDAPKTEEISTPAIGALPPTDLPVRPLDPPSPVPPLGDKGYDRGRSSRYAETEEQPVDELVAARLPVPGEYSWPRKVWVAVRPVVVVTGAAMGAFVGMNHLAKWMAPEGDKPTQVAQQTTAAAPSLAIGNPQAPAAAADLAAAPPGEEKVARKTVVKLAELDLPEGLTVPPGKGLLEVDSGGQHKLYVDNVFVGRGPLRRIPIDPGSHQVQTQLDGVEEVHEVSVTAGRRARLELTESAP